MLWSGAGSEGFSSYVKGFLNIAQVTAFYIRSNTLGILKPEAGRDVPLEAAAAVNFLSGDPPHPYHRDLDLVRIRSEAIEWLKAESSMRELVVQSLRLSLALRYAETGIMGKPKIDLGATSGNSEKRVVIKGPILEPEELLLMFGHDVPVAPTLDSYRELVSRTFEAIPKETLLAISYRGLRSGHRWGLGRKIWTIEMAKSETPTPAEGQLYWGFHICRCL